MALHRLSTRRLLLCKKEHVDGRPPSFKLIVSFQLSSTHKYLLKTFIAGTIKHIIFIQIFVELFGQIPILIIQSKDSSSIPEYSEHRHAILAQHCLATSVTNSSDSSVVLLGTYLNSNERLFLPFTVSFQLSYKRQR